MANVASLLAADPGLLVIVAAVCIASAWQVVNLLAARAAVADSVPRGAFAREGSTPRAPGMTAREPGGSAEAHRDRDQVENTTGKREKRRTLLCLGAGGAALLAGLAMGAPLIGVLAAGAIVAGEELLSAAQRKKAQTELEKQILQLEMQMAENSRAGLSVERSLRTCLEHTEPPLQGHLERMVNELTFSNRTLSAAFADFADRSGSEDARLLANVIDVQQETGSNLADTLDFLAQTIGEKQRLRQTLRSRVAEMQLTKTMVAAAPVLVFAICCVAIEGVSDFYLSNPIGWMLLAVCAAADLGGVAALNKMSDITID